MVTNAYLLSAPRTEEHVAEVSATARTQANTISKMQNRDASTLQHLNQRFGYAKVTDHDNGRGERRNNRHSQYPHHTQPSVIKTPTVVCVMALNLISKAPPCPRPPPTFLVWWMLRRQRK